MNIIIFLIILFLFLRKNCNINENETFNNIQNINKESSDNFFNFLKNDTLQKQSVRNLLF